MPEIEKQKIFLSYARSDGEAFVQWLYDKLTESGFDVWWDRESMPSRGRTFLHEIREAIGEGDRFVVVIGPGAISSEYVRAEWMWARERGATIHPVLRIGGYELLPLELASFHAFDFSKDEEKDRALDNFVAQLSKPAIRPGERFGVPTLPEPLVAREWMRESIKRAILSDLREPAPESPRNRVGIIGMGGAGKSTLAAVVARDYDIRRAFSDGIIWLSCGKGASAIALQRMVFGVFSPEDEIQNVDSGRVRLASVLRNRNVLIVFDDLDSEEIYRQGFDVLDSNCRILITTRDKSLLTALEAVPFDASLMEEGEARELLCQKADCDPDERNPDIGRIAETCGHLPLALSICGALVRDGRTWADLLHDLQSERLESLTHGSRSLTASINLSVSLLGDEERVRFGEFSAFPAGVGFAESAILTLWAHTGGLSDSAGRKLLLTLERRCLVTRESRSSQGAEAEVQIHNLVHDFAVGLAGDLVALHGSVVDAYLNGRDSGLEDDPDDCYFRKEIAGHLAKAERWEELWDLVAKDAFGLKARWLGGEAGQGIECLEGLIGHLAQTRRKRLHAAGCATRLGRVYSGIGEYDEAEAWQRNALNLANPVSAARVRAVAWHELASISFYRSEKEQSRKRFWRAVCWTLCPWQVSVDELAANLLGLATLARDQYRFTAAIRLAKVARFFSRMTRDVYHALACDLLVAGCETSMGRFDRSEEILSAVEANIEAQRSPRILCTLLLFRGWNQFDHANLEEGDGRSARKTFEKASEEAERSGNHYATVQAKLGVGWCMLAAGEADRAEAVLAEIRAILMPGTHIVASLATRLGTVAVSHVRGDLGKAAQGYRDVGEELRSVCGYGWAAIAFAGEGAVQWHGGERAKSQESWAVADAMAARVSAAKQQLIQCSITRCKKGPGEIPR